MKKRCSVDWGMISNIILLWAIVSLLVLLFFHGCERQILLDGKVGAAYASGDVSRIEAVHGLR